MMHPSLRSIILAISYAIVLLYRAGFQHILYEATSRLYVNSIPHSRTEVTNGISPLLETGGARGTLFYLLYIGSELALRGFYDMVTKLRAKDRRVCQSSTNLRAEHSNLTDCGSNQLTLWVLKFLSMLRLSQPFLC
ncbi:hypothetical protein Tco_0104384 [Tanacetum coccineum]